MDITEATKEVCKDSLKPFFEALEGLKKDGFKGIARVQTVEWPLVDSKTLEIVLELRKEISQTG
jgi:uncharacterized protein (UPF0335 family)